MWYSPPTADSSQLSFEKPCIVYGIPPVDSSVTAESQTVKFVALPVELAYYSLFLLVSLPLYRDSGLLYRLPSI
jgi:hypothetical protein